MTHDPSVRHTNPDAWYLDCAACDAEHEAWIRRKLRPEPVPTSRAGWVVPALLLVLVLLAVTWRLR